ncbi:putative N-acetyltransferase YhbS [Clostridium acetobutylicum]|uniref:Predicted acetyltransferase n=1 Tax=Clostridium acetobutylicum (strain ATCC 824 / DSM 792 / JCM 1419 / IAM 19013 / LMG 5710 / NBRC 13948 / NRRL B-527 / VKM B-1787 / 2291 / W) TaxID=272562 RepID=Q97GA1_CLOAB|nr:MULTISPECIES: GNAT family N-acetyltransferase [Clostridium]AAK80422.1 Predicted acetyltransferase [Clostridium acetobutylicum ATCC 824]ADZ21519.1 acetyltransferase [Clostridium acetobutylicum EA 2018]AEI32364.1 acetyltransferase [Clostridium acetobutylicum DSM 1731]AWV79160.1 GNAT family N-acetyltransferase [Clostridium acetobutylicum]MBC2394876.1 GNAT family N-acetyltransferase [Clostridium acetobutylicum]
MVIEKLRIEDIPQLLKLYNTLAPFESSHKKSLEVYNEMLKDENYLLLAAKKEEEIIGSVLGICCKGLMFPFLVIEDVIVKEEIRGKGVGRKLMKALDEFANRKNCSYAILVSSGFREGAHKFYERVGFKDSVRGFRKIYY